jgi:hypothetical protein
MKSIGKYKEQDPVMAMNLEHKLGGSSKRPSIDSKTGKVKETPRCGKKEEIQNNLYNSHYSNKRNFFSNK